MGILVVGSLNADVVLRLQRAPEAGETVLARGQSFACGGKGGNTACALGKLETDTRFFGAVGVDAYGKLLTDNLAGSGVDTSGLLLRQVPTGTAYILLEDSAQNRIIVNPGANATLTAADIRERAMPLIREADMVTVQLEIPAEAVRELVAVCREENKPLVVDAGPAVGWRCEDFAGCWCVSPNETELGLLQGKALPREEDILEAARHLHSLGVKHVPVKLGDKGCLYVGEAGTYRLPAYKVKAVDTTAAGDSFTAGWCAAMLRGASVEEALDYANRCGAIAVTRMGAGPSLPTAEEAAHFSEFCQV